MRFVVGETIEDTYDELKKQWRGDGNVHIDAWMELCYIDGYEISLSLEPSTTEETLYFVNAGGYDPMVFGELHEVGFYVTQTNIEATKKALNELCLGQDKRHEDDKYDVDDCVELTKIGQRYIHLSPTKKTQEIKPAWYGYGKI